jgi:polyhydroxybutyrate depolymerase
MGPSDRSAGCVKASALAPSKFVEQKVSVGGGERSYFVRLPAGYDPMRGYPVVYQFHGCSDGVREDNNVPVHNASKDDAIVVRGRAAAKCWDTGKDSADVPYIDAMMAATEQSLCVDKKRRFASGYSSGAFMTHHLACIRGASFRGVASIAGGQTGNNCTGNVAALMIHDANDGTVNVAQSVAARDDHAKRNRCSATRAPTMPSPCEAYAGCDAKLPVVWCQTTGKNHDRQDALAAPAFWSFFSGLN